MRKYGYTVFVAQDEDMLSKSDEEQLAFAAKNGWVLVTHNVRDVRIHHQYCCEHV